MSIFTIPHQLSINTKKINIIFVFLVGIFLNFPTVVSAGTDSGFYIGVGAGEAKLKAKNVNESNGSGKILGGYNFGIIPLINIAVEAAYINFGKASRNDGSVENSYDLSGSNVYGLLGLNFGAFGIFAKAGAFNWSSDIVINNLKTSNSGTDAAYGIGARVNFDSMAVRLEYEVFDASSVDELDMLSISILYRFI